MEKSEPTLVPQWLKNTGSVTGSGGSSHHFSSSSSHSDVPSVLHTRTRNSKSGGDFDTPRSAFLDRSLSSNSRKSSSNGSARHAYSSFNRNHRDRDRERDKERLSYRDLWDRDSSNPLGNIMSSRMVKDLRRSHSMVSRKQSELLPRRVTVDSKIHNNGNDDLSGGSTGSSIKKAVFDKDFPSLGSEEKQGVPDIGRVSSPGLSSAVQNLPVGNSTLIGGEGWTSALAEVPPIIGSSGSGSFSAQTGSATTLSGPPSAMAGLNMAEALAQAPSQSRTAPQLPVNTQRLDELTIKKSKQLIPVTPSMPKSSVLNFSDKGRQKTAGRISEMNIAVKNGQQKPSSLHHANLSLHVGNVKSDVPKTSHGKLLVLKPAWENGVSHTPKDGASPTNNANSRAATNQIASVPSVASAPPRSPNNPKLPSGERKATALNPISGLTVERRSSTQTQSRNDFFNLLKKKTSMNTSVLPVDLGTDSSSPAGELPGEVTKEVIGAPPSPHAIENGVQVTTNGGTREEVQKFSDVGEKTMSRYAAVDPDEEAAFLRSLGWEENSGEDEGLTEEEIKAFYLEFEKRGMQLKLPQFHPTHFVGASSSSDSGSEA